MATLQMRNYGTLGGNGTQSAATDASTWSKAVADATAGDTIHIAYAAGQAIIKPPTGAAGRKNGVDFAIDEAVEIWPQQGTGESFPVANLSNTEWGIGNLNGLGAGSGPLGKAGKWGVQLNRRKNPAARGDGVVARFQSTDSVAFRHMWVESMCETLSTGQCTDYCASAPCFAFNAPNGQASAPTAITLDHVTALNCTYGYGLLQMGALINGHFIAIAGDGGTTMRGEQQSGNWMRLENLIVEGVYAYGGNCGVQLNPHIEHVGALGASFAVTDVTCESMGRAYLFNTDGRLDKGYIDGLAVLAGTDAQIAVSSLPGGGDPNKTTDGRTSQSWKRGATYAMADTGRGVVENADMQVRNVIWFGNIPTNTIPTGGDVTHATSEANLRASARWQAGFDTGPPPTVTDLPAKTGGATPSGVLTKSHVNAPTSTSLPATGNLAPSGVLSAGRVFTPAPQPVLIQAPLPNDPHPSAFFQARASVVGTFIWKLDGTIIQTTPGALIDQVSVPTSQGSHSMLLDFTNSDGVAAATLPYSWVTVQQVPPLEPVEPPLPAPDTLILGCGYHTAYLQPRGGGQRLGTIPHTGLKYDNTESVTGTASVTIGEISRFGDECCHLISSVEEWTHEIELRRNGPISFVGAITSVKTSGDSAEITASDMSVWFTKRRVHKAHAWTQQDVTRIARDIIIDAMSSDKSPGIQAVIDEPQGILLDYQVPVANTQLCSDVLRQLTDLGLAWRMIGRVCHLGLPGQATIPAFTENAFSDDPDVVTNAGDDTNDVVITGNNEGDETPLVIGSASDQADRARRGALESVHDQPDLANGEDAGHVSQAFVDEGVTTSRIIEGGKLAYTAPAVFGDLAPLLRLDLLVAGCRPVRGRYRISKRSVSEGGAGDEVAITIEPLVAS